MHVFIQTLELVAKYAWAAFFVSAFILFIPDNIAYQLDFLTLRSTNTGNLWIVFLFTGFLAITRSANFYRRYVIYPFKKFVFPTQDFRTKIQQSRIRYRRTQFLYLNGDQPIFYQGFDSNGVNSVGYFDDTGHRILPTEPNKGSRALWRLHREPKMGRN